MTTRDTPREDSHVMTKAEVGVTQPEAKKCRGWEGLRKAPSLETWGSGCGPAFEPLASKIVGINVCCFKPPRLWYLVTEATGN